MDIVLTIFNNFESYKWHHTWYNMDSFDSSTKFVVMMSMLGFSFFFFLLLFAGSTIQAVYHLEKSGLRAAMMEAVQAATMKSKQTGRKEWMTSLSLISLQIIQSNSIIRQNESKREQRKKKHKFHWCCQIVKCLFFVCLLFRWLFFFDDFFPVFNFFFLYWRSNK